MSQATGFSRSSAPDSLISRGSGGPPTRRIWIGGERVPLTGDARTDSPMYSDLRVPPALVLDLIAPRDPKDLFESAFHDFRARVHSPATSQGFDPEQLDAALTRKAVQLVNYCYSLAEFLPSRKLFYFSNENSPTIRALAKALMPLVSSISPQEGGALVERLWKLGWYNKELVEALLSRITNQGTASDRRLESPARCAVVAAAAGRGDIHQAGLFELLDHSIVDAIQSKYQRNQPISRESITQIALLFEGAARLEDDLPKTVAELSFNTKFRLRNGLIPDLVSLATSLPRVVEREALNPHEPARRLLLAIVALVAEKLPLRDGANAVDPKSHEQYSKIIPPIAALLSEIDPIGAFSWLQLHSGWVTGFLNLMLSRESIDDYPVPLQKGYYELAKAIKVSRLEDSFPILRS